MATLQELSRRLLARDLTARLVMSPDEPSGRLVISEVGKPLGLQGGRLKSQRAFDWQVHFNGHVLSWDGVVDHYSKVDDLLRIATMACGCC